MIKKKQPKCVKEAVRRMYAKMGCRAATRAVQNIEIDQWITADYAAKWAANWYEKAGGETQWYMP